MATQQLDSLAIDIFGPLPQTKEGKQFLIVIADLLTKLT